MSLVSFLSDRGHWMFRKLSRRRCKQIWHQVAKLLQATDQFRRNGLDDGLFRCDRRSHRAPDENLQILISQQKLTHPE